MRKLKLRTKQSRAAQRFMEILQAMTPEERDRFVCAFNADLTPEVRALLRIQLSRASESPKAAQS